MNTTIDRQTPRTALSQSSSTFLLPHPSHRTVNRHAPPAQLSTRHPSASQGQYLHSLGYPDWLGVHGVIVEGPDQPLRLLGQEHAGEDCLLCHHPLASLRQARA